MAFRLGKRKQKTKLISFLWTFMWYVGRRSQVWKGSFFTLFWWSSLWTKTDPPPTQLKHRWPQPRRWHRGLVSNCRKACDVTWFPSWAVVNETLQQSKVHILIYRFHLVSFANVIVVLMNYLHVGYVFMAWVQLSHSVIDVLTYMPAQIWKYSCQAQGDRSSSWAQQEETSQGECLPTPCWKGMLWKCHTSAEVWAW